MFRRTKMWISTIVSMLAKDRGTIPADIGNSMLILNNIYITKKYINSIIAINELSTTTPVTFLGEYLTRALRDQNIHAVLDFVCKNTVKSVDLTSGGIRSRKDAWEATLDENEKFNDFDRERASRLLYTVKQVEDGDELIDSKIFLILRAKTGDELYEAEKLVLTKLRQMKASYKVVTSFIEDYMKYLSLISNVKSKRVKDFSSVITTASVLAQLLPNTHALSDSEGLYFGTNVNNNTPYRFNFRNITMGRNIYCLTNTGGGKTVMASNLANSALEEGYRISIMDIKGNEFTHITESVGGVTISLRESSRDYINSFAIKKPTYTTKPLALYFKDMVNFSKEQIIILSGVPEGDLIVKMEGFLDYFFDYLYASLGVRSDNENTWVFSEELTPFVVFERLQNFLTNETESKYATIMEYLTTNLSMYFTEKGSRSYLFTNEMDFSEIFNSKALRFDFGILDGVSYNPTIFKLKFAYMSRISGDYVTYNYAHDLDTFTILEEVQAVSDAMIEKYSKEYTLRRAQRQTTLLIGNSIAALTSNPKARPIIETTTALLLGKLQKSSIDLLVKHFDVNARESIIRHMSEHNDYLRHFLFINFMEENPAIPILKVQLDPEKTYEFIEPTKILE